jgi:hypothetical protein
MAQHLSGPSSLTGQVALIDAAYEEKSQGEETPFGNRPWLDPRRVVRPWSRSLTRTYSFIASIRDFAEAGTGDGTAAAGHCRSIDCGAVSSLG